MYDHLKTLQAGFFTQQFTSSCFPSWHWRELEAENWWCAYKNVRGITGQREREGEKEREVVAKAAFHEHWTEKWRTQNKTVTVINWLCWEASRKCLLPASTCSKWSEKGERGEWKEQVRERETGRNEVCVTIGLEKGSQRAERVGVESMGGEWANTSDDTREATVPEELENF